MNHNEYSLSQIIASLKWYARVASEIGHCTIKQDEIHAYLNTFKELTEESKKWEEAYDCADSARRELSDRCDRLTEENERLRERNIVLEQKFIILDREEIPVLKVKVKGE